jgi:uncharacterized protein (DUF2062 family)
MMGRPIVPQDGFYETFTSMQGIFSDIMLPCWVGGVATALPVAMVGYWLTYQGVVAYRVRNNVRRKQRMHKWHWSEETGWYRGKRANSQAEAEVTDTLEKGE